MIDLFELRKAIKDGVFVVYSKQDKVYIKDAQNEECIMICDLKTINNENPSWAKYYN